MANTVEIGPPPVPNRKAFPFVGSVVYQGIPIDIEQRKGDVREGVDRDGHKWKVTMHAHYGELRNAVNGMDGDKIDVYVGPDPDSRKVVLIDQRVPDTGEHDEQKAMLGFTSVADAVACYRKQYDGPGWYGGHVVLTVDEFKRKIGDKANAGKALAKAFIYLLGPMVMAKGRQANVGEVRTWTDGKQHRKTVEGWEDMPHPHGNAGESFTTKSRYGPIEYVVSQEREGANGPESYVHPKDSYGKWMPKESVRHFHDDLNGIVRGPTKGAPHPAIAAVLRGHAKYLGKGDDGVVFGHKNQVVKVSTTVPFQPMNDGHLTPKAAANRLAHQGQVGEHLRKLGVPGILPTEIYRHGDKAFLVRDYVDLPEKLTKQQLDDAAASVHAMHKHGWTLRDSVQVGVHNGETVLFDTGKAAKMKDPNDRSIWGDRATDHSNLARLYKEHGHEYQNPDAAYRAKERWLDVSGEDLHSVSNHKFHKRRLGDALAEVIKTHGKGSDEAEQARAVHGAITDMMDEMTPEQKEAAQVKHAAKRKAEEEQRLATARAESNARDVRAADAEARFTAIANMKGADLRESHVKEARGHLKALTGELLNNTHHSFDPDFAKEVMGDIEANHAKHGLKKAGGPYIGPKGGKWADPQHKQHWNPNKTKVPKPVKRAAPIIPAHRVNDVKDTITNGVGKMTLEELRTLADAYESDWDESSKPWTHAETEALYAKLPATGLTDLITKPAAAIVIDDTGDNRHDIESMMATMGMSESELTEFLTGISGAPEGLTGAHLIRESGAIEQHWTRCRNVKPIDRVYLENIEQLCAAGEYESAMAIAIEFNHLEDQIPPDLWVAMGGRAEKRPHWAETRPTTELPTREELSDKPSSFFVTSTFSYPRDVGDSGSITVDTTIRSATHAIAVYNQFIGESDVAGFGLTTLTNQAHALSEMSKQGWIVQVRADLAGRFANEFSGYNGYYTWPQLGYYDAPEWIDSDEDIPGPHREGIRQLMSTRDGAAWWRLHGEDVSGQFDVTPGSYSMRRLEFYARHRASLHAAAESRLRGLVGGDLDVRFDPEVGRYGVWDSEGEDIIGMGLSRSQAIQDALKTAKQWEVAKGGAMSGMDELDSAFEAMLARLHGPTLAKGGGPYIGPRGGKWADPEHTISWQAPGTDQHHLSATKQPEHNPGTVYHASHLDGLKEIKPTFSGRGKRTVNTMGTWFSSSSDVVRHNYGPHIYAAKVPSGKFLEAHTTDFERLFFDADLARKRLTKEEFELASAYADNRRPSDKLVRKYQYWDQPEREVWLEEARSIINDKLLLNWGYVKAWRQKVIDGGHVGVLWRNSGIDQGPDEPRHDVYLYFGSVPVEPMSNTAESPHEAIVRQLSKHEMEIRDLPIERLYAIGAPGEQPITMDGTKSAVAIPAELGIEWGKRGTVVLTHNHPTGCFLSAQDFYLAHHAKLAEIRAVTSAGVYAFKQPPDGWMAVYSWYFGVAQKAHAIANKSMKMWLNGRRYNDSLDESQFKKFYAKADMAHTLSAAVAEFGADHVSFTEWPDRAVGVTPAVAPVVVAPVVAEVQPVAPPKAAKRTSASVRKVKGANPDQLKLLKALSTLGVRIHGRANQATGRGSVEAIEAGRGDLPGQGLATAIRPERGGAGSGAVGALTGRRVAKGGAEKPPPGYSAIPNSKHGGFHKRIGNTWHTWYADFGHGQHPTEKFTDAEHDAMSWRGRMSAASAAEIASEMGEVRKVMPSSVQKRFGTNGPTPEQKTAYDAEVRAVNSKMSFLRGLHKKALTRDNEAFHARSAEAAKPAPLNWDAQAMIAGNMRPGTTSIDDMARVLKQDDDPRRHELTHQWLRDNWSKLEAAKSTDDVFKAFDSYDSHVSGVLRDEQEARDKQVAQGRKDAVERSQEHRQRNDPGRVSTPEEGAAWASGGALPQPLYHATLAGQSIMATGFKAREDFTDRTMSLGGGPENTVSTTPNLSGAYKIAAMFAAMAEGEKDPAGVKAWLDEHWLPLVPPGYENMLKQIEYADARPDPFSGIKERFNIVSQIAGYDHPHVLVPVIMAKPKLGDLKDIGVVTAYAHVDAVMNDRGRIASGPGSDLHGESHLRVARPQNGVVEHHETSLHRDHKHLQNAHIAIDTENKAEQGEIRVAPEDTTVVGFEPVSDWRAILSGKMAKASSLSAAFNRLFKSGGPFIGPRGGKWADAAHTIAWKERRGHNDQHHDKDMRSPRHKKLLARLEPIEREIRDAQIEHLAVASGKNVHRQSGEVDHVMLAKANMDRWAASGDAVMTHNHPSGQSFSSNDIRTAYHANLAEIRAVTSSGVWSFIRPDDGWERAYGFLVKGNQTLVAEPAQRAMERYVRSHGFSNEAWHDCLVAATHKYLQPALIAEFGSNVSYRRWTDRPGGKRMAKAGGPFIGPKGGKWADPQHTVHWEPAKPTAKKDDDIITPPAIDCEYPRVKEGDLVDGLRVGTEIDNTSSIGATLEDYTSLGLREVPMEEFGDPRRWFYDPNDFKRSHALAEKIKVSGYVNPLIVVVDKEGPYILEGGHRIVALHELGKRSFPALVIRDDAEPEAP